MPPWKPVPAGSRYGRLVILVDRVPPGITLTCRCDCGAGVTVKFYLVMSGHRSSCGCLHREHAAALKARHGMAGTKIYHIWADMVARCTRQTHARWADYGGRGITVCERWRDFANFYADMGERPSGHSLDRRDNDRGYSPENCRWATFAEQRANRRPQRRKPACKAGHQYTEASTGFTKDGKRVCRICVRRWAQDGRERRAAVAA